MSYSAYLRVGITDPASKGFPALSDEVEDTLADLPDNIVADIMSLLDPLQEKVCQSISARACFGMLGYPTWHKFLRVAMGLQTYKKAILLPKHYSPVHNEAVCS